MQAMTIEQINARLVELDKLQADHSARDLDAELSDVMGQGGDVDALEEAQLEAERQARRYRVERQALEKRLPEAKREQAEKQIKEMTREAKKIGADAEKCKAELSELTAQYIATADRLLTHREQSANLARQADSIARATGATVPEEIGAVHSVDLARESTRIRGKAKAIGSFEHKLPIGSRLQGINLDG